MLSVLPALFLHQLFPASAEECFTNLSNSREALEKALAECQAQIEKNEKILEQQTTARKSTESDILLINTEIKKGLVRIRQIDLAIKSLGEEIGDKEDTVEDLAQQLTKNQQFLRALLQRINESEQEGFARFLFSNVTLSSFFTRVNEYQSLRETVEESIRRVVSLRERVVANIDDLEEKKNERGSARQQQRAAVNQVQDQREQKRRLLDVQVAQEKQTTEKLSEYEGRAAEIRNRIFELSGSADISFGQAVQYAKEAEQETGVRPAFLLGLIKNESDLGKNVGTGNYLTDMHPTRDAPIFPYIAKLVGFKDPAELKVSANPGFGWGGAMGPAQFIPSTWVRFGGLINVRTGTASPGRNLIQTTRILQVGSTGGDVRRLQQFLNQNGFTIAKSGEGSPGNESNRYTNKVAAAVSRFQEKHTRAGFCIHTGTLVAPEPSATQQETPSINLIFSPAHGSTELKKMLYEKRRATIDHQTHGTRAMLSSPLLSTCKNSVPRETNVTRQQATTPDRAGDQVVTANTPSTTAAPSSPTPEYSSERLNILMGDNHPLTQIKNPASGQAAAR